MEEDHRTDRINVHIEGDVSGQIAIGDNILQIGDVHGGVVNIVQPGKKPTFSPRQRPVMLRPRKLPGFLNRESEMSTMVGALNSSESVSIYAENGMGKTALLRRLAYSAPGDNFPDGILYMAAHIHCVDDLLQIVFDHFYESDSPAKPTDAELHRRLQDIEALIMLDDAHLCKEDVTELINAIPRSIFVLASPERCLWGEGCCLELQGLPLQEALTLIEAELKRTLTPSEQPFAEALYQLRTGQPLFLIQAAALVREGKSFKEIAAAAEVSRGGFGQILAEKLSETQNNILKLLDVFKEIAVPKKHLAALAETKDLDAELKPLKELHLVNEFGSAVSLAGPLILPVGALHEAGWETHSFDYFVRWVQGAPSLLEIRESLDLLLFLLGRAASLGHWEAVIALGRSIERALILSGLWSTWSQVLKWILEAAGSLSNQAVQAWALHQLGTRSLCLGDLPAAQSFLAQALGIREALADQAASALTRQALGVTTAPPPVLPQAPLPHPGIAPWTALSPVVKVALIVGGTVAVATAVVRSTAPSAVPPEPPVAASPVVIDEPPAPLKEVPVLPVPIPTEKPVSTKTTVASSTVVTTSIPVPMECTSHEIKFVVARQLQYEATISFDVPFDLPNETMNSTRDIDLREKLTVYVNGNKVTNSRTGLYDPARPDRLFIMLAELHLNDAVQVQLRDEENLYCSPVTTVHWIDPLVPTHRPTNELITDESPTELVTEEPTFCVDPGYCTPYGWNSSWCCCCQDIDCNSCY